MSKTHFFIFSFSRSGSTVLGQKLNNHSEVKVINESGIFTLLGILKWKKLTPLKQQYLISQHNKNHVEKLSFDNTPKKVVSINDFYQSLYSTESIYIGEKTPTNLFYFNYIYNHINNAKFIFLRRHPLAIANSYFNRWYDAHYSDRFLIDTVSVIKAYHMQFIRIDSNQCLHLKYEDLVINSEQTLQTVSSYLGIRFEKDMMNESSPLFHQTTLEKYHKDAHKKLTTDHLESYKHNFSPSQLNELSYLLRNEIKSLGYPLEPIIHPTKHLIKIETKIQNNHSKQRILFRKTSTFLKALLSYYKFCAFQFLGR